MSETKVSFTERTKRSLKKILYRYMEDNGYKYIHKLTQIVTTLKSRRHCSTDLIPKNVKHSDFLSILYSKMRLSAINYTRQKWSRSFNSRIVYNRVGCNYLCATISRQYTELFYKVFTRATECGRSMGGCNFPKILPINVPKSSRRKKLLIWQELVKVFRNLLSRTYSLSFHYG